MTTQVRVSIATTAGTVAVERVAPVALRKSKVFTWRGTAPLAAISAGYDEFIRKRVARILPSDGAGSFRIDLSGEIDTGDSWQLAVLVAHALHGAERLAGRDEDGADTCLYATGTVDFEMSAGEVGFVEDKLRLLARDSQLHDALQRGRRVIVALPEANRADGREEQAQLRAMGVEVLLIGQVEDLLKAIDLQVRPRGADPEDPWEGSPFRGLKVFDVRHRKIFWGRGRAREEALQLLRRQDRHGCSFLLIHGSSGVGKSSLARAGLLADLEQTASADDRWRSAVVLPNRGARSPVTSLADALATAVPELSSSPGELAARLLANPSIAARAIADELGRAAVNGRVRLALLVDQIEELLLWARDAKNAQAAGEREAFAETLSQLARTGRVWVIGTLRSDLMSLLEDSPVLSDLARNDRLYRLERPRPGALGEIIRRPAELAGLSYVGHDKDNASLVDVLTDAAKRQQDCLPLLQFTLKLLFDDKARKPGTISYAQYETAGGLENAIGNWADRTIEGLTLDPETDRAIDDVVFNLARRGRGTDVVVAADFMPEEGFITPARERVIKALSAARLIVLDFDTGMQRRTARVAHEALLTHWSRARSLFETHAVKLALKDDIERSAGRWADQKDAGKAEAFLILGEAPLVEAEQLLADSRVALSDAARSYIEASLDAHRDFVDTIETRLARDEQKIGSLIGADAFGEAEAELDRVVDYLSDMPAASLRSRCADYQRQRARIRRLAAYSAHARTVFPKAGQEEFEEARLACEGALHALDVLDDAQWLGRLPAEDLSADQVMDLKREIYRMLLLYSGLQLVPVLRSLSTARRATARRKSPPAWAVRLLLTLVPKFAVTRVLQRSLDAYAQGMPTDNRTVRDMLDRCLAALRAVRSVEEAVWGAGSERSRTSMLVERLVEMLSALVLGSKIDVAKLLAVTLPAKFAEPINAPDFFFVALFNYFIAKRRNDGTVAGVIQLLQGNFPQLDGRAPLVAAERLLRTAIALESRNFWPHWVLGRTLQEAGDHAAAELAFNTAIALEPRYARGYEQRALSLAKQWTATGDDRLQQRARTDSRRAGHLALGDPSIYWPRGELLDELGETREALNAYCLWLELEKDILGTVARSSGVSRLYKRANAMLFDRRARSLHADAGALLALIHWISGEPPAALEMAEKALELAPRHSHALAVKGVALLEMGKPSEALADALEPAFAASPQNFWMRLHRARALEQTLSAQAALDAWQELLDMGEDSAQDRCPPWICAAAEEAIERLRKLLDDPRQQAQPVSALVPMAR